MGKKRQDGSCLKAKLIRSMEAVRLPDNVVRIIPRPVTDAAETALLIALRASCAACCQCETKEEATG